MNLQSVSSFGSKLLLGTPKAFNIKINIPINGAM